MSKRGELKAYNTKIIEPPSYKEIWIYEEPIIYRAAREIPIESANFDEEPTRRTFDESSATDQYESLKRKQRHYEQMRWVVARLVDCNFDDNTKFLTLTFQNNVTEIAYTNDELKKFLKRLNYHFYKSKKQVLKYIATWEKQQRGAIHYHIIFFDFPYVRKQKLEELWGHGFTRINRINVDSKENRGRYVSKYFSKDLELKEHKKKAFFTSQNLKKPQVRKLALTSEEIRALEKDEVAFAKDYPRRTYVSEIFRTNDEPDAVFKESNVRYLRIRR